MDTPKTRKESKKNQQEKGGGKNGKYSSKHIRAVDELMSGKHLRSVPTMYNNTHIVVHHLDGEISFRHV